MSQIRKVIQVAMLTLVCVTMTWKISKTSFGATPGPTRGFESPSVLPETVYFVGSVKCAGCHQDLYNEWLKTGHSKSMVEIKKSAKNERCLSCHVTDAFSMMEEAVGCEACHGPGSVYSHDDIMRNSELAHLLGLTNIDENYWRRTCGACHGEDSGEENFDGRASWKKIAHPTFSIERKNNEQK